ncbi:MAG TPA: pyridine nucleotide-disulfide oxidoreductase [Thiomicrospira sp.]|jgi:sulfide:quinone oxidoreductase|nr:pyridine nucleotide-disulfide oxidoreductase [Thiomicrospira sp.]
MKITILGTGFAALTAIKQVRKKSPTAEITVISPKAEMLYYPSLIWFPAKLRKATDLIVDLNNFFTRQNVTFFAGKVLNVIEGGRVVETDQGNVENDGLIIATGGRFIKKLPGIEHAITPCEGISAAEKITDKLSSMTSGTIAIGFSGNPKEPSAMRGGPMFEFLFGIDTLLRRQGRRENFKLVFFTPAAKPGLRLGDKVPDAMLKMMAKKGIETHLGSKMVSFEADKIITESEEILADLILFMPGMTGPAWLQNSELVKSEGGLIKANQFCQVEGLKATYVAGDSGSFPGPEWQAKQAHMADLQAIAASNNLVAELEGGEDFETFKHELICIVDSLSHGMLVKRTEKGTFLLPPCRLLHFAKRIFEKLYLRGYR